ncbi:hypothetical protein MKY04_18210 [Lysinibacillus telephonicus]|uniref:hypothetical protein n=1 Tax=Lysinibacillus telephonicus TaxID=1714840 RepID=UPI0031FDCA55
MTSIKERALFLRFPWAKVIIPEMSEDEKDLFFYDSDPLDLTEQQYQFVYNCFEEIEEWFNTRNIDIEVSVLGINGGNENLRIQIITNYPEIHLIVDKYQKNSGEINSWF